MTDVVKFKPDYSIDSVQTGDLLMHIHIPSKPKMVDIVNYNDYYNSGEYNRHTKYRNNNPDFRRYYYHICGAFFLEKSPYIAFDERTDMLRPNRPMVEKFGQFVAEHNNATRINHVKNWRDKVVKRWSAHTMADVHSAIAYEAEKIIEKHYRARNVKNFMAGGAWSNESCCSCIRRDERFKEFIKKCGSNPDFPYKKEFICESNMGFSYQI